MLSCRIITLCKLQAASWCRLPGVFVQPGNPKLCGISPAAVQSFHGPPSFLPCPEDVSRLNGIGVRFKLWLSDRTASEKAEPMSSRCEGSVWEYQCLAGLPCDRDAASDDLQEARPRPTGPAWR